MALDPQVKAHLDQVAALGLPANSDLPPAEARRLAEENSAALFGPVEEVAHVEDTEVGGVPVRAYDPRPGDGLPVLVYLHGGGWVIGSRDSHDGVCRAIANRVPCRVLSVEYRLAPEHRFPAAVDDAWAVTRAVLGAERVPVAVGGDSAGGNLSAVMALRARDAGLPLALQLLIYPVTDSSPETGSYRRCATGYGMTGSDMAYYWQHYLGEADPAHPDASPLRAPTVAGVAPAHVVVCEYDVLHDEGVAYAERLRAEGVPATVREEHGMIHGFIRMSARIDRARDAWDDCAAALRGAFAGD
jgi:acetyl esterase